jgi:hypothetical protein
MHEKLNVFVVVNIGVVNIGRRFTGSKLILFRSTPLGLMNMTSWKKVKLVN